MSFFCGWVNVCLIATSKRKNSGWWYLSLMNRFSLNVYRFRGWVYLVLIEVAMRKTVGEYICFWWVLVYFLIEIAMRPQWMSIYLMWMSISLFLIETPMRKNVVDFIFLCGWVSFSHWHFKKKKGMGTFWFVDEYDFFLIDISMNIAIGLVFLWMTTFSLLGVQWEKTVDEYFCGWVYILSHWSLHEKRQWMSISLFVDEYFFCVDEYISFLVPMGNPVDGYIFCGWLHLVYWTFNEERQWVILFFADEYIFFLWNHNEKNNGWAHISGWLGISFF